MRSKIPLHTLFLILDYWAAGLSGKQASILLRKVSSNSIYMWYDNFRQFVVKFMAKEKVFFTGDDITVDAVVQIDESKFGKVSLYNRGKRFARYWVFGISQQSTHKCYIQIVQKRDNKTLMRIIKDHVDPHCRMLVVTDGWAGYNTLKEEGYQHSVVVHKEQFVNREGRHTNSIESVWSQFKTWINGMHGVRKDLYNDYAMEFMYRYNYCRGSRNSCLEHFLGLLKHPDL